VSTFTDATGERWTIEITVAEIKQLRTLLSLDLLAIMDDQGQMLKRLASDPVLLVDVISVLLTEQITKRGLDERSFAARLVGEGLSNAMDALMDSIANFTPPPRGAVIKQAWAKVQQMDARAIEAVSLRLASQELERELDTRLAALLSDAGS